MSINLTNILQKIQGIFTIPTNGSREVGVVLKDTDTVSWDTDGYGNILATAEGSGALILIQKQTLSSPQTSVTFNVPQNFSSLRLTGYWQISSGENLQIQFNGDTGNNYSFQYNYGTAESAQAYGEVGVPSVQVANLVGIMVLDIPSYVNAPFGVYIISSWSGLGESTPFSAGTSGGMWNGTNITSIVLSDSQGGTLAAGSTFELYGVS